MRMRENVMCCSFGQVGFGFGFDIVLRGIMRDHSRVLGDVVLSFKFMIYDYFNVDEFEAGKLVS
jgi:hypothetical protein